MLISMVEVKCTEMRRVRFYIISCEVTLEVFGTTDLQIRAQEWYHHC